MMSRARLPRTLKILGFAAAALGSLMAVMVIPSIPIFFLSTDPATGSDYNSKPLVIAGLLLALPLFVAAPLAFAAAVYRRHRAAVWLGLVWWTIILILALLVVLAAVFGEDPAVARSAFLTPLLIALGALAAMFYFARLLPTFGVTAVAPVEPGGDLKPTSRREPAAPATALLRGTGTVQRRRRARDKRRR